MADFARFNFVDGGDVLVDLDSIVSCWESKITKGNIVFVIFGSEIPIEVIADFDTFVKDYLSYYDCRIPKEKPRRPTKRRGSLSPPVKLKEITPPALDAVLCQTPRRPSHRKTR